MKNYGLILSSTTSCKTKDATLLQLPEDEKPHNTSQKVWLLDINDERRAQTVHQMHEFYYQLAKTNVRNSIFWYLPVAEFQPFMSCIYNAFEVRAFLEENLKERKKNLLYINSNLFLLNFLKNRIITSIYLHFNIKERIKFAFQFAKTKLLRYYNLGSWFYQNLKFLISIQRIKDFPLELDVLFISRFEKNCEDISLISHGWYDTYFGELPSLLKDRKIAILGRCGSDPKKLSLALENFKDFPAINIYQILSPTHLLKILFKTIAFKLSIDNVQDKPMARLAYWESRNHCWAIADCLMVEEAVKVFLKKSSVKKIIMMQENAAWEHAVVIARNKVSPQMPILGYFHCPVMPSSFRYHIRKDIRDLKPFPDKIITLGKAMSEALSQLGDWKDLLINGYAFRTPNLDKITQHSNRDTSSIKVLVLLGGNFCHVTFLQWIQCSLNNLGISDCTFLVKSHPRLNPASDYLDKGNISYGSHGIFYPLPQDISIRDALEMCDCVLFKGTTAGFFALAAGLPIAHYCHGGILSDNVFFNRKDFCDTISTENDLLNFLQHARLNIDNEKRDKMKEYLFSYYESSNESRSNILEYINNF